MIESPIANDSITNKQSNGKASIYHTCLSVLNALNFVDGFDIYLANVNSEQDPLTKLWEICKQGSSLCYLYNQLRPDQPINLGDNNKTAANKSKACVYHFIVACRDQLLFPEETLFTVTELMKNDTNGFVKVVNTIKRVLDMLEENGIISVLSMTEATTDSPKDMRDNVVFELLSTERKYVQDLEALQEYMREVQANEVLSPDTMHYLFGNLNALVDFQRRFLIQVEDQASQNNMEQRFGKLFIECEEAFSVYEPFCANFQIAQDLVIQESGKLQKLSHIMSPTYELPSMLIKPIQRVCKYPLLVQQLIKSTPDDWQYQKENKDGLEVIQRITMKVNETKRVQENLLILKDLKKRIIDENIEHVGSLLLHDKFNLLRQETDQQAREVNVYLFDKMILICKEIKEINKNAISIKKRKGKEGSMVVRGKIYLSKIEHIKGSSNNGNYILHLTYIDLKDEITVYLKCRNDEHLRQWLGVIIPLKEVNNNYPQTPRVEQSVFNYDEDEEDYYDEQTLIEEDLDNILEGVGGIPRNRSYSYQYNRTNEVSSRKASLSSQGSNNSNSRHFMNGMPGMTLPPLPKSPNTNITSSYPPSSPPNSYPSSPTSRTSSISNQTIPSGALWQRRQQPQQQANDSIIEEEPIEVVKHETAIHHIRQRSQSSPNIPRPNTNIQFMTTPELPTISKRSSESTLLNEDQIIKVKVHYFGAIYVVIVPNDIEYDELQKRIESKIKLCGQEFETSLLGLKYEDEDGDLITISSSEDVQMGFENRGPNNAVNLYVTS